MSFFVVKQDLVTMYSKQERVQNLPSSQIYPRTKAARTCQKQKPTLINESARLLFNFGKCFFWGLCLRQIKASSPQRSCHVACFEDENSLESFSTFPRELSHKWKAVNCQHNTNTSIAFSYFCAFPFLKLNLQLPPP